MAAPVTPAISAMAQGDLGPIMTMNATPAGTYQSGNADNMQKARGIVLGINVTALTGTLTITLQGIDKASGQTYTLLASPAIAATGFSTLTIFPGAPATANVSANAELPASWTVQAVGATGPCSATIGASLLY